MQAARELADLLEPGRELVDRDVEQRVRAPPALARAGRGMSSTDGEPLLRAVVEVALDALALGVGDLDEPRARGPQLRLGPHAVGDVAQVAGERRRPRQRDPRDRQLDRELACRRGACRSARAGGRASTGLPGLEEARQPAAVRVAQAGGDDQVGHVPADRLVARGSRRSPRRRGSSRSRGPRASIVTTASSAASSIARSRDSLARTSSSAWRRATNCPTWLPSARHRRQQPIVGLARARRRRTPSRPTRPARAAQREAEAGVQARAAGRRARGKFASSGASVIHAGSPLDQHAPGQALARREHSAALSASNSAAPLASVPGADAAQAPVVGPRPPRRRRAPSPASRRSPPATAVVDLDRRAPFPPGSARRRAPRAAGRAHRAASRRSPIEPAMASATLHPPDASETGAACASSWPTTTRCCARVSRRCSRTRATRSSAARGDAATCC